MIQQVELQRLAGARVRDTNGRVAGRIESIRGERIGPRCVVHEYRLGTVALLSRLGITALRIVGVSPRGRLLRVPWQQLDLSNPDDPRLRCTIDELRSLQNSLPPDDEKEDGPPA